MAFFKGQVNSKFSVTAHGSDWIDSYSLKLAAPLMEDALIHLINLSLIQSKFSARWKPQLVFPLHKKKDKVTLSNYRPVCHLVQVGKIAEYAVFYQILNHFQNNNLFHRNQHGSLPGHSTSTALIQVIDFCLEAAENQELSAICLLDQSAAYDLLCHQTLKDKLRLYNFDENSVDWVMSYLGGRTQYIQVESQVSEELVCGDYGAPQGSVLAGLLHVISCNDFPACHEEGQAVVYVDDDTDCVSDCDPDVLKEKITSEAGLSAQWLEDNRLCVAADKSKLLIIGTQQLRCSKTLNKISIDVKGEPIQESNSEKLLGLVINNQLTWKDFLYGDQNNQGLVPQLSKRVGMLKSLSKHIEKENLKPFVNSIFYSKLNYCLAVFGNIFGLEKYKEENRRYSSFTI